MIKYLKKQNIKLALATVSRKETIDIYIIYKVETREDSSIGPGEYMINDNSGLGKRNTIEINSYKKAGV